MRPGLWLPKKHRNTKTLVPIHSEARRYASGCRYMIRMRLRLPPLLRGQRKFTPLRTRIMVIVWGTLLIRLGTIGRFSSRYTCMKANPGEVGLLADVMVSGSH